MQDSDGLLNLTLASVRAGANTNASTATKVRMTVTKTVLIWLFSVGLLISLQLGGKCASDETMMFSLFGGYVINTFVLIALGQMKMAD